MKRLVLELTPRVAEVLDWIVHVDRNFEPDDFTRRRVLVDLMLDHARKLRERAPGASGNDGAYHAPPDELAALRRERDALRKALEAERALRRRDRERYADMRRQLVNGRAAVARLRESLAKCRDLAVRVEAALLRAPVRADPGSLEDRLRRALRGAGFSLPDAAGVTSATGRSRAPPRGHPPPKRRGTP